MATYTIIGGDGKEYGPITSADVRQWITEGRLNHASLVKAESDAEFRPLEKFPEFADLFGSSAPGTIAALPSSAISSDDYELDLGGCISRGYESFKNNFGTLFLSALVLVAVQFAASAIINMLLISHLLKAFHSPAATELIGLLTIALGALVNGPLIGGFYLVYLKAIRGEATGVGEVFAGFQKCYGQLVLGALVVGLISAVCLAPFNYVAAEKAGPMVQQLQNMQSQQTAPADVGKIFSQMLSAYTSALPILIVCLIPLTYLTVSWQFTLPLILDKQLTFGAAMKTSWQRVNKHWWQVFGLTILVGLVSVVGILACGVGILFTMPIGMAAMMIGYETIFGTKPHQS